MTVAELIEELKKLPQDATVVAGEAANDAYISEVNSVYLRGDLPHGRDASGWTHRDNLNGCVEIGVKG